MGDSLLGGQGSRAQHRRSRAGAPRAAAGLLPLSLFSVVAVVVTFTLVPARPAVADGACVTAANTATCTFSYNGTDGTDGSVQTWVVPQGVTWITVVADGAQGGNGGNGGEGRSGVAVTPGETLWIRVGGDGGTVGSSQADPSLPGGYNGGGYSAVANGGGASDVRRGADDLQHRVVVGGGGGGGGVGAGGVGGGTNGGNGGDGGLGGGGGGATATGGGAGGAGNYDFGGTYWGGAAGDYGAAAANVGPAGGGGLYGGGGGGLCHASITCPPGPNSGGGGGGSGFVPGGCTTPSDQSASCTAGVRSGHGLVVVSWALVPGPPAAPETVTAAAGNAEATVTWSAPDSGGAVIDSSTVTATPGGQTCTWSTGPRTCTVTGLTNGTSYTFRVVAHNALGDGPASAPSNAVVPVTIPGRPSGVTASAGDGDATVTWIAPPVAGGISSYVVQSSPDGKTCVWTSGPLQCTVTGLTNGTPYAFTVVAHNAAGYSAPSNPSNTVVPSTVPGPPTAVTASAGHAQATVTWSAPAENGGSAITAYTVMSNPSGKTCGWSAGPLRCTVTGMAPGTTYTFTVTAANSKGTGAASAPSNTVVPWSGTELHPLAPRRILDSRGPDGGWNTKLTAASPKNLTVIGGADSIPASAEAVIMNVTVTGGTANSFVTVYPSGGSVPTASNVNFAAGETIANLVTVEVGANGQVAFANNSGAVDVIADIVGYFDASPGDRYTSLAPTRVLDSRGPNGGWNARLGAGAPKTLAVGGVGDVPETADAVVMNVKETDATANSLLTVYPAGGSVPLASNLNFAAGQTIANLVTVKLGTDGKVAIANNTGATHVVVDVVGYFDPTAGAVFHALAPNRILDSRGAAGGWHARLAAGAPRSLAVTGAGGIPAAATAVVGNVTVTQASANSFLTVYPAGAAVPVASNLNFGVGQTIPNLTIVELSGGGQITFNNASGATHVIFDVVGYFADT